MDGTARVDKLYGSPTVVAYRMLDERNPVPGWRHTNAADPPGGFVNERAGGELELGDAVDRANDGHAAIRRPVRRHDIALDGRRCPGVHAHAPERAAGYRHRAVEGKQGELPGPGYRDGPQIVETE